MGNLISDALTKLMNAERVSKKEVVIKPVSKLLINVMKIIKKHGYIKDYKYVDNNKGGLLIIKLSNKINKIGSIRPRYPCSISQIEQFEKNYLPASNFGIIILSTDKGLITHQEAREKNVGGALIAYCY